MEWVVRIIGVVAIFGLAAWSVNEADRAIVGTPDETVEARAIIEDSPVFDLIEAAPPEYLAYGPGFSSGVYRVADGPDSADDRADGRNGSRRSDDDDETFVEYDLVPGQSQAERGEVEPGLYATSFEAKNCRYELRRVMQDREERTIGQDHLQEGRMLVTINEIEPDRFVASPACGEWIPWSPVTEALLVADNGDYWIGDLARGRWVVPDGCYWEKVVAFRGAELYDIETSGIGPAELVVDSETLGVRIRGCTQPIHHKAVRS